MQAQHVFYFPAAGEVSLQRCTSTQTAPSLAQRAKLKREQQQITAMGALQQVANSVLQFRRGYGLKTQFLYEELVCCSSYCCFNLGTAPDMQRNGFAIHLPVHSRCGFRSWLLF